MECAGTQVVSNILEVIKATCATDNGLNTRQKSQLSLSQATISSIVNNSCVQQNQTQLPFQFLGALQLLRTQAPPCTAF